MLLRSIFRAHHAAEWKGFDAECYATCPYWTAENRSAAQAWRRAMLNLAEAVTQVLQAGQTVYLPGATGESQALAAAFRSRPEALAGVRFVGCFVPGMNGVDYAGLHHDTRLVTFMLPSAMRQSFAAGRVRVVPATYHGAARILAATCFDVAFAQVSPPDAEGRCSLGIASDFAPIVWHRASRRVLLVNPRMPPMPRAPSLAIKDAHLVVEADGPLIEAEEPRGGMIADRIAAHVAAIVPDHAAIQTGIGAVPTAVWQRLTKHKGLALRSGLVPDGFQALAEAGALADPARHVAGIAFGSGKLYRFLAETDLVTFRSTDETHSLAALAACERFHAINSALEVDLLGRLNVAWQDGRMVGGVGGLPDFARAATVSRGGCSIIALPATAKGGSISRIVPVLRSGAVGIGAESVDLVVTEHGVADLRGLDMDGRAEALIGVAEPDAREMLASAWHDLRRAL